MPAEDGRHDTPTSDPAGTASRSNSVEPGKKRKAPGAASRGVASLTPDQLAKKRANDREAQRAIRERTRAQIEGLERRIQELTSQQPYQELQLVLRQKQAVQDENDAIKRRLASVLAIIQPIVDAQASNEPTATSTVDQRHLTPGLPSLSLNLAAQRHSVLQHSPATTHTPYSSSGGTPEAQRNWTPSGQTSNPSVSPVDPLEYQRNNLQHGLDLGGSGGERLGLNFLLDGHQQIARLPPLQHSNSGSTPSTPSYQYRGPSNQSQPHTGEIPPWSTPVRTIPPTCPLDTILLNFLHSRRQEFSQTKRHVGPAYPSVSLLLNPDTPSDPLTKVFADILSKFPEISGLPEKVAMLYSMFMLMRWQINPSQENYERLPEWLCPRISQILCPHPAWVDYIPWPRMRDRLIADQAAYPFETWFVPYTTTISINWPYEPTDALLSSPVRRDRGTGEPELVINPVFERHIRDLRNWSVGPTFANAFPDLVVDGEVRVKG